MGFPEGSNMKAPGDSDFPFGAFFCNVPEKQAINWFVKNPTSKKGRYL
jgi:hypothetical protein